MNGISADSKQGFDADVLGLAGTGESPTLPEKSGGKNRGRKGKKTKERPRISVISTNSSGSVVKIQDGATCIASSSIPNLVPVQLGNAPDPPVLSIPDTAADNETISRLLGGQGAALLELGSSDCVNIDFIQDNVDYSDGPGVGTLQSQSSSSPTDAGGSGARDEIHPEPSASRSVTDPVVKGSSGNEAAKALLASLSPPNLCTRIPTSALDLSMKHQKLSNISVSEVLSNLSQEIRTAKSKKGLHQVHANETSSISGSANSETLQGVDSNSKRVSAEEISMEHQPVMAVDAEFTDPTGDSLLLNIAQVNKAIAGAGGSEQSHDADGDASTTTQPPQPPNPLMYIITSRDKTTGMTQRFRVTVDPESVMYIPVMNINDESSSTATNDEVSLNFMPVDEAKDGADESGPARAEVDIAIRDALLGEGNMTSIPGVLAKEDLGAITGDMITSALMLQERRNAESPKDDKIDGGHHGGHHGKYFLQRVIVTFIGL